jgi:hypothetical protein
MNHALNVKDFCQLNFEVILPYFHRECCNNNSTNNLDIMSAPKAFGVWACVCAFVRARVCNLGHKIARNYFPIYLQDMFLDLVSGFHVRQS